MSAGAGLIEELEASLRSRSSSDRLQLLRSVTDLFLGGATHHSEDQLQLFDDLS
jgi:hypothetical protein